MLKQILLPAISACILFAACGDPSAKSSSNESASNGESSAPSGKYEEGTDYEVYERVRIMDNNGFSSPVEAQSLLLPKGWTQESQITWKRNSSCNGTSGWMKGKSADGKFTFEMFPSRVYMFNDNQTLNQMNSNTENCTVMQPMDAVQYLKQVFTSGELGNAEVSNVKMNDAVVAQMQSKNESSANELRQYGAGQINFNQTAVNAELRWPDGSEGFVILGANTMTTAVPNIYDGTSSNIYTTEISPRVVFKYPKGEKETAKSQFAAIMSSIRTNTAWSNAVNSYWKQFRGQSNAVHQEKIRMNDELTRSMGRAAIAKGQQRLNDMDNQMRNWEQQQSSQDRMHTNFIKTIREVENFKDATGTYEMTSSYNHAWSRGDGNSFIMSNNPNFNPASVFQDQNWQQMKKVD